MVSDLAAGALAANTYRSAGIEPCCDPLDLAEALGLELVPAKIEMAVIAFGVLRFPNRAKLRVRGLSIFLAIARFLMDARAEEPQIRAVANELAMPRAVAARCSLGDLANIQPHYPIRLLENIVATAKRSGAMAKNSN